MRRSPQEVFVNLQFGLGCLKLVQLKCSPWKGSIATAVENGSSLGSHQDSNPAYRFLLKNWPKFLSANFSIRPLSGPWC